MGLGLSATGRTDCGPRSLWLKPASGYPPAPRRAAQFTAHCGGRPRGLSLAQTWLLRDASASLLRNAGRLASRERLAAHLGGRAVGASDGGALLPRGHRPPLRCARALMAGWPPPLFCAPRARCPAQRWNLPGEVSPCAGESLINVPTPALAGKKFTDNFCSRCPSADLFNTASAAPDPTGQNAELGDRVRAERADFRGDLPVGDRGATASRAAAPQRPLLARPRPPPASHPPSRCL